MAVFKACKNTAVVVAAVFFILLNPYILSAEPKPFVFLKAYSGFGHEIGRFNKPKDMAFSPDGRYLAVSDTYNNRVQLFSVKINASGARQLKPEMVYGGLWPWDNRTTPIDSADAYREKDFLKGQTKSYLAGRAYSHGQSRIREAKDVPADRFNLPVGVAWLGTDTIMVADTANHRIKALELNGETKFILGKEGFKDGYFHNPLGLDVSCEKELYAAEPRSKHIRGLGLDVLYQKHRMQGGRVQIFDKSLKPSKRRLGHMHIIGGIDYNQLKDPSRVLIAQNGDIYVSDSGNHRILIFDKNFALKKELIEWELYKMRYPKGIDLSKDGRLAIADTFNNKVIIVDADYKLIQVIGGFGSQKGKFIKPHAVRFGPDGDLYVLDTGQSRIQVFTGEKIKQFPRCPKPKPQPKPMPLPIKLEEVLPPPVPVKDSY